MAFVYWIKSKTDTDILSQGYVGITIRKVNERVGQHVNLAKRKQTAVGNLLNTGEYEVVTLCECDIDYAGFLENKLRPSECIGLNLSEGGNTSKMTTSGRESVSRALKGVSKPKHVIDAMNEARRLKGVSTETRCKLSLALKGRRTSAETREKMSAARKLVIMPARNPDSTLRQIETFKNKHPLDLTNVNMLVWKKCNELYDFFNTGYSRFRAGNVFGFSRGSLRMMWVRFENGFNPRTDSRMIAFTKSGQGMTEGLNSGTGSADGSSGNSSDLNSDNAA